MVALPSDVTGICPKLVTLPPNTRLAPLLVTLKLPLVFTKTSPSVPEAETEKVPPIRTVPMAAGVPLQVTVLPAGMIAISDGPGMPLGSHVLAVFQTALLVAVKALTGRALTVNGLLLVMGSAPEAAARVFVPGRSRLRSLK